MSNCLKIGLIAQGGRDWIGGSLYIKNIALALSSLPTEIQSTFKLYVIYEGNADEIIYGDLPCNRIDLANEAKPLSLRNKVVWKINNKVFKQGYPRLQSLVRKEKIDFLYPCFMPNREFFPSQACPWIPDFQHKHFPEFFSASEVKIRDKFYTDIANHGKAVVLSSQTSESDFKENFPNSKTITKVLNFRTSPNPDWFIADPLEIQYKYYLPDKFFLLSGQFWKHKNHLIVLEALKLLRSQKNYPTVVCTGHIYDHRQSDHSDNILYKIHTYGLAQQFILLGLIPRIDQIQLMRRSIAVLQPSIAEGWSTVVEDARCLGKPIILSDIPVHLEQNPFGSKFFDKQSPDELAVAMLEYWQKFIPGPDLEQEKLSRLKNIEDVSNFGYQFLEVASTVCAKAI